MIYVKMMAETETFNLNHTVIGIFGIVDYFLSKNIF